MGAIVSEARFVADVMLGRLARWLRALGHDTLYFRDAPDSRLLGSALRELAWALLASSEFRFNH